MRVVPQWASAGMHAALCIRRRDAWLLCCIPMPRCGMQMHPESGCGCGGRRPASPFRMQMHPESGCGGEKRRPASPFRMQAPGGRPRRPPARPLLASECGMRARAHSGASGCEIGLCIQAGDAERKNTTIPGMPASRSENPAWPIFQQKQKRGCGDEKKPARMPHRLLCQKAQGIVVAARHDCSVSAAPSDPRPTPAAQLRRNCTCTQRARVRSWWQTPGGRMGRRGGDAHTLACNLRARPTHARAHAQHKHTHLTARGVSAPLK